MVASASRGPYRFLLRGWEAKDDVELACRILESDPFRGTLAIQALPLKNIKSFALLAPHQDDESIGAGGTLLLASKLGAATDIIYVTDGAQSPRSNWYARDSADSIRIRDAEATQVCSIIGAKKHDLKISNLSLECDMTHLDRLVSYLWDFKAEVLLVPWLWDEPLKHRFAIHLLWLANRRKILPKCEIWSYQVHSGIIPNGYVDVTDVASQKRELLRCFHSQNSQYYRYDHIAMGLSAWNSRFSKSAEERYWELFFCLPSAEYFRFLERHFIHNLPFIYRGNFQLIKSILKLQEKIAPELISKVQSKVSAEC